MKKLTLATTVLFNLNFYLPTFSQVYESDEAKQIFQNVSEQEIRSMKDFAIFFKNKDELVKEIESQKNWLINHILSDMYRKKLISEFERDQPGKSLRQYEVLAEDMKNLRLDNLLAGKYSILHEIYAINKFTLLGSYGPKEDNKISFEADTLDLYREGGNYPKRGDIVFIYIEGDLYSPLNPMKIGQETIPIHELSHQLTDANNLILKNTKKEISSLVKEDDGTLSFHSFWKDKESGIKYSYLDDPSEVKARINALRYLLYRYNIYDSSIEEFKETHLQKMLRIKEIRNDSNVIELFSQILKSKMSLFWLMNKVA